jgi:hypothetical protein
MPPPSKGQMMKVESLKHKLLDRFGFPLWDSLRVPLRDPLWDSLRYPLQNSLWYSLWDSLQNPLWDSLADSIQDAIDRQARTDRDEG